MSDYRFREVITVTALYEFAAIPPVRAAGPTSVQAEGMCCGNEIITAHSDCSDRINSLLGLNDLALDNREGQLLSK